MNLGGIFLFLLVSSFCIFLFGFLVLINFAIYLGGKDCEHFRLFEAIIYIHMARSLVVWCF